MRAGLLLPACIVLSAIAHVPLVAAVAVPRKHATSHGETINVDIVPASDVPDLPEVPEFRRRNCQPPTIPDLTQQETAPTPPPTPPAAQQSQQKPQSPRQQAQQQPQQQPPQQPPPQQQAQPQQEAPQQQAAQHGARSARARNPGARRHAGRTARTAHGHAQFARANHWRGIGCRGRHTAQHLTPQGDRGVSRASEIMLAITARNARRTIVSKSLRGCRRSRTDRLRPIRS